MVAYSFQAQFIGPILSGRKRQTLRNDRKRHARSGETIQLYTAMRTRHCKLIGTARCTGILICRIDFDVPMVEHVESGKRLKAPSDRNCFAQWDGFESWMEMEQFWAAHHPGIRQWQGVRIFWRDLVPAMQPDPHRAVAPEEVVTP